MPVLRVQSTVLGSCKLSYYLHLSETHPSGYSQRCSGICLFLDIILIGGSRVSYRYIRSLNQPGNFLSKVMYRKALTKVLIVGAGDAGASMIREIRQNPDAGKQVVAVIDDDRNKIGRRIVGKKIVGGRKYITKAVISMGLMKLSSYTLSFKKANTGHCK